MKSWTWQQTLVGSTGLALAACCLDAGRLAAGERVFDNNFAEVAAWVFFQRNERWPTNIVELAGMDRGPLVVPRYPLSAAN